MHSVRQACLIEIQEIWCGSPGQSRPDMVWIAEHLPVPPDTVHPRTPVLDAWLMKDGVIEHRSAIDFVRFMIVQTGECWSSGGRSGAASIFHSGPGFPHSIGLAAFAPIQDSAQIYLEFLWGGALGRGSEYIVDPKTQRLECVRDCWIS